VGKRSRIFLPLLAAIALAAACGDSDDTPLGSQFTGDLLGSTPGVVFQDSFEITGGDTSYVFYPTIDKQLFLEVGIKDDYERTTLIKGDFSGAGPDVSKTVSRATIRLNVLQNVDYEDSLHVWFYNLGTEYSEGDSVEVLDTTYVIPDPDDLSASDRVLRFGTLSYELPPALVQGWIRGDSTNNGIAIVYARAADEALLMYSREGIEPPSVTAFFGDGTQTNYSVSDDCIYVRPMATTSNLIISDGFVRRMYFPIDLSQVRDSAAVHKAGVVFNLVPGTVTGTDQRVLLYVPGSSDPASEEFLTGRNVTASTIYPDSTVLELPLTNVFLLILSGELANNGFVLMYDNENSDVRQAEFYGSDDAALRPEVFIVYSTPADFEP
jgi:hypothetical protein